MGRKPSIARLCRAFERGVSESVETFRAIQSSRVSVSGTYRRPTRALVHTAAEAAFVSTYAAWESFLTHLLFSYMVGARSPADYAPRRNAFPTSTEFARGMFLAGRPFIRWADFAEVRKRIALYLVGGNPFETVLSPAMQDLTAMRVIRNASVHEGELSQEEFQSLVRRAIGTIPRGYRPGSFLLEVPSAPRIQFVPRPSDRTVLEAYSSLLGELAGKLAP